MVYLPLGLPNTPRSIHLFVELEECFHLDTPPTGVLTPAILTSCKSRTYPSAWHLGGSVFPLELCLSGWITCGVIHRPWHSDSRGHGTLLSGCCCSLIKLVKLPGPPKAFPHKLPCKLLCHSLTATPCPVRSPRALLFPRICLCTRRRGPLLALPKSHLPLLQRLLSPSGLIRCLKLPWCRKPTACHYPPILVEYLCPRADHLGDIFSLFKHGEKKKKSNFGYFTGFYGYVTSLRFWASFLTSC